MNRELLKQQWLIEEQRVFQGWDFSAFEGCITREELPWDYKKIVTSYLKPSDRLLDIGTGGGEFLLTLRHPYDKTTVTEGYFPNYNLCQKTLTPLGIDVSYVGDDLKLNFEADSFDLIINRHAAYDIGEVYRILKPKGVFITQQVGGGNNRDLSSELLGELFVEREIDHNLKIAWQRGIDKGFAVLMGDECYSKISFNDIGTLVYFAKIIEWEFPGFSVDSCFEKLYEFQKKLESGIEVESTEHRYYLIMKK